MAANLHITSENLVSKTKIHGFERKEVTRFTTALRRQADVGVCVGGSR